MSVSVAHTSEPAAPRNVLGRPTAIAVILAAGLSTWGAVGDHFHAEELRELAIVFGIIAVAAGVVFGLVVPRGLRRESAGIRALALGVLGFLSIAVFWSGLPPVLAVGAIVLGWAGRHASHGSLASRAAIAVGVVTIVADVFVFVQDQLL